MCRADARVRLVVLRENGGGRLRSLELWGFCEKNGGTMREGLNRMLTVELNP